MYKILAIVLVLALFGMIIPYDAFAHQSGYHRWHSCPSDRGTYTCGDKGYCSQCPDNNYCKAGKYKRK